MKPEGFRERNDPAKRLADLRTGSDNVAQTDVEAGSSEVADENEAYSILSADRQQKVMLELRFKTGNSRAFAYSYLVSIDFNPSSGIVLDFSGYEVAVSGRNLSSLFAGLVAQRVAVINEMDDLQAKATLENDATVVTSIEIKESH